MTYGHYSDNGERNYPEDGWSFLNPNPRDLDMSDVEADAANDPTIPANMRTQELVREFAQLKVWFAVNEVTGRVPEGNVKHARLGDVVDAMRARSVLD